MLKVIKNIPKKFSIPIGVVGVFGISVTAILSNLENFIEKYSPKFINGKVIVEDIDLSLSNTQIKNLKLYDDKNNLMFDAPEINILTSFKNLTKGRIDEVDINSSKVFVIRDKDGVINFTKLQKTKSDSKPKNPVNKLLISNLEVNYEDETFENKLQRKIENINLNATASKDKLVETAEIKVDDKNIKLNALLNDKTENEKPNLDFKLKIDKFLLDKELLASLAKNNSKLHFSDIDLTSDLSINTDKTVKNTLINGSLDLNMPYFRFDDIDTDIKKLNLHGDFKGQDGIAKLGMNIFEKDKEFVATYKDKQFNSTISFDRVDENILNRIVAIREKKLDLKNIKIENIKTIVHFSDEKGFIANLGMNTNDSEFRGLKLKDFKLTAKSKNGKNQLVGNISTKVKNIEGNILFNVENEKENTDISLKLNSSLKNDLIPNLDIKAKIENQKENLRTKISSNVVDFNFDYEKQDKKAKIYGDKFNINYDMNSKKLVDGKGIIDFNVLNLKNYIDFTAENNEIQIKELKLADSADKNKNLIAKGKVNLENGNFVLNYVGQNLVIDRTFGDKKVFLKYDGNGLVESKNKIITSKGEIENLTLNSVGKIDNLHGNYSMKKTGDDIDFKLNGGIKSLAYEKYNFKDFKLDFIFANNKVKLNNFSNNQISMKADYDVKSQKADLDFELKKLTDKDIALDSIKFVSRGLKAKVSGTVKELKGFVDLGTTDLVLSNGEKVKILGKVNLNEKKADGFVDLITDNIKLPNGELKFNYSDNIIFIKGLNIVDKNYGEIFGILGQVNLKNKTLNIKNKNSSIDLTKLQNMLGNQDLKGKLGIDLLVNGELASPKYNLNITSNEILFKKYKIEKILFNVAGNKDKLNINNLDLNVYGNKIKGTGFIDLSQISSIDKEDIIRQLPYRLHIWMDEFKYDEKDIAKLKGSSDIVISNEKIYGNIFLKEGTIYDIPNDYKSVFSILKSQIAKKKEKNLQPKVVKEESKEKKDIQKILNKLMPIDLKVITEQPLIFNTDNFNIAIPEFYGKLNLDVALKGQDGKYYVDGETELSDGVMSINTNEFTIDRLLVVFNNNSFLPKINPNIFFETRVEMDDNEYRFDILGQASNLRYSISSKNGKTGGDLSALIKNPNSDKDIYSFGDGNEVFLTFMKNLIAGQVAQAVFGSVTRYTKRKLDLTKLVVKPEVTIYNPDKHLVNSKDLTTDNKGRNPEIYSANIKLQAKDDIYRDKLFWKADIRILGTSKEVVNQTMKIDSKIRDYDLGFEYKIDENKTIEVGAGTVPDKYRIDRDKDYRKTNYHIGYKIRKRYNSFSEIFSF